MFGKSDASTSTTDDVKVRPLWVYYFPQALGVLSAEPPSALPAGGDMWATPARARRPGALVRPSASPATTLLTDEPWLSSSSSEPRRLFPYARFLPPLRLPTPRSLSPDSDDIWPLPARPTKLSLPPIDIPQIETIERDEGSPCSPSMTSVTTVTAWSPRPSMRSRVRRRTRGVRKRRPRLADMQRIMALLPRRTIHGAGFPSRCSAALRAALRELRTAWTSIRTPNTYIVGRNWSLSEQELPCEQESNRSSSGASIMSRRAMWAELGARPGASPGLLRRRYSAPETIMRKYRLEQQREACCSSVASCRSPASSPGRGRPALSRRALLRAALQPPPPAPALEHLEVVVTETVHSASTVDYPPPSLPLDIDEYVSSVLVESLNSLTDRIESVITTDSRLSIVEKEIKVRLQHTGVNTIVHLSPTSNNQIIFGNEELCNREEDRDECNNVVEPPPRDDLPDDANNNPPAAAVLRQLQRLFQGAANRDSPEPSRIEISNVDVFLDSSGESPATISVVAAPRAASPPRSLVDSLEDPASPRRGPVSPVRADSPPGPVSPRAAPEAFFVGMRDDAPPSSCSVADVLPARIKQRLQRRQRRRQQRAECRRRRPAARDAAALLDALLDEIVSITTKDEYKKFKTEQKKRPTPRVPKNSTPPRDPLELRLDAEKRARRLRGRMSLQPHPPITSSDSRRLYQKSEITEGGKRVEILEILEYVESSSSSPETSAAECSQAQRRRSRIPVPVSAARREDAERLRRLLQDALEPRADSLRSLRLPRVFDAIPEELSRSAATSPPPRAVLSRATMTSPARRHAATSPRRPAAATPPPRRLPLEEKRSKTPERQSRVSVSVKPVETSKLSRPASPEPLVAAAGDSSSSCEERGLLCVLPRRRRAPRRRVAAAAPPPKPPPKPQPKPSLPEPSSPSPGPKRELEVAKAKPQASTDPIVITKNETSPAVTGTASGTGWSVTVAGERVPPHELQLRLRFPPAPTAKPTCQESGHALPQASSTPDTSRTSMACACRHCRVEGSRALPPAHPPHPPTRGSSRACEAGRLPSLRRDSIVSQVKRRGGCSPRCWLPADLAHVDHHDSCLQVVGAAVVPLPRAARRHR